MSGAGVFLSGTLCDAGLRDLVLGPDPGEPVLTPARLGDCALFAIDGRPLPRFAPLPGAAVDGVIVTGLSSEALARLTFYESCIGNQLIRVRVLAPGGPAEVQAWLPAAGAATAARWTLADWQLRWAAPSRATAQDILALQGQAEPAAIAARYYQMLVRGASRLRARDSAPTRLRHHALPGDVVVERLSLPYANFFAVEEYDLRHRRFDGEMSPQINRATFVSGDAVTVLPYDPARDRVLLIEQFRAGPHARGDAQCWHLEAIAGRVDPEETPEETARREAMEEAGVTLGDLLKVAFYYPSNGAKTEYIYSYVGLADLPDGSAGVHGLLSEAEDIRGHLVSFDQMMALVASGEIANAPLLLTALWLQRERPRLRGAAPDQA